MWHCDKWLFVVTSTFAHLHICTFAHLHWPMTWRLTSLLIFCCVLTWHSYCPPSALVTDLTQGGKCSQKKCWIFHSERGDSKYPHLFVFFSFFWSLSLVLYKLLNEEYHWTIPLDLREGFTKKMLKFLQWEGESKHPPFFVFFSFWKFDTFFLEAFP